MATAELARSERTTVAVSIVVSEYEAGLLLCVKDAEFCLDIGPLYTIDQPPTEARVTSGWPR